MNALEIVLMCVAAALVTAVLRTQKPEIAFAVALAAGVAVFWMALPGLKTAAETITEFAARAGIGEDSQTLVLRAAGVALIAEFGAQLCQDAGESALAGRIELGVRVMLFVMAAPLLTDLLTIITEALA